MSQIYLGDKIIASTLGSDIKYDENTSVNDKIDEHATLIDEQNKNLQWYIDNGYLPNPNAPFNYLYDNGNRCIALTGGWLKGFTYGAGGIVSFNSNYMCISNISSAGNYYNSAYVSVVTVNAIDLTNVSKIVVLVEIDCDDDNGILYVTKKPSTDDPSTTNVPSANKVFFNNKAKRVELDTSSLTGFYNVALSVRGYSGDITTAYITEIYYE